MKYDISISDSKTYLYIKVSEPVTEKLLEAFICETAKKASKNRIDKFLFDLRCAPNQASVITHYDFVYVRSKQLGFKPHSKHALLVNPEDMDDYNFVETVLINAQYKSKMFTDELSAIKWLDE